MPVFSIVHPQTHMMRTCPRSAFSMQREVNPLLPVVVQLILAVVLLHLHLLVMVTGITEITIEMVKKTGRK